MLVSPTTMELMMTIGALPPAGVSCLAEEPYHGRHRSRARLQPVQPRRSTSLPSKLQRKLCTSLDLDKTWTYCHRTTACHCITLRAPLSKAAWPISRDQAQAPTAFGIAAFKMCSDAGRGSRRRDLHPKGDVCAGHKLASDIRWLYLLLAACAPVHAPLTRGHRLPPGTSGPSGSPGGARP